MLTGTHDIDEVLRGYNFAWNIVLQKSKAPEVATEAGKGDGARKGGGRRLAVEDILDAKVRAYANDDMLQEGVSTIVLDTLY